MSDGRKIIELVLDIPTLSQGNPEAGNDGKDWCGRTSACMVHNYLRQVDGESDLIVNSRKHGDLVYPDGTVAALGAKGEYLLGEPLNRAKAGWPDQQELAPAARREGAVDDARARALLAPVIASLDRRMPLVAYTSISESATTPRHIVVISGYREKDGELWLHVDDPSTMKAAGKVADLGPENVEVLCEGEWGRLGSRYWLRARTLFARNTVSTEARAWCDHCNRPNLAVFMHPGEAPVSKYVRVKSSDELSLPLDLGAGLALTSDAVHGAFELVERQADGGWFPLSRHALWHGGVHLPGEVGAPVRALAHGEVVCARLRPEGAGAFGSPNFIIVRHTVKGATLNDAASEPSLVGFRALGPRTVREAPNKNARAVASLAKGDLMDLVDPDAPPTFDEFEYHEVVIRSPAAHAGKRGWVGWAPDYMEDLHGKRGAAFDDAKEYAWYSLSMHLGAEPIDAGNARLKDVAWLRDASGALDEALAAKLREGGVVAVGRRVKAGQPLWPLGVGPVDGQGGLHLEAFSSELLLPKWRQAVDETANQVDFEAVLKAVGQAPEPFRAPGPEGAPPQASPGEVARFYREDHDAGVLRRLACRFPSEWALDPGAHAAALEQRGFITAGLQELAAPYAFWSEAKAAAPELPDAVAWRYHPIALLEVLADGGQGAGRQCAAGRHLSERARPAGGAKKATDAPGRKPVFVVRGGQRVPHFFQGDDRWGARVMGRRAVRTHGSSLTCIAMLLRFYGRDATPATLDDCLDAHQGYAGGDSLRWSVALAHGASSALPALRHHETLRDRARFAAVLEERCRANEPTIARVDWKDDGDAMGNAYVVIVGRDGDGRWIMNDPSSPEGDGAKDPKQNNVLDSTTRHGGFTITALELVDVLEPAAGVRTAEVAARTSAAGYGGHKLRLGDDDDTRTWGGAVHGAEAASHVQDLQRDLVGLGYWVSAPAASQGMACDGSFGETVRGAVKLFQREHGLDETGVVDAETARSIQSRGKGYKRPGHEAKKLATATQLFQLPPSARYNRYGTLPYDDDKIAQDNWGTRPMIDMIIDAGNAWAAKEGAPFLVGDISLYDGGPLSPHKTHKDGTGVDIAGTNGCDIRSKTFDKEESVRLADTFAAHGAKRILFNCKYVIDKCQSQLVKSCDSHHHHFHIDVVDAPIRQPKEAIECLHCNKAVYAACTHEGKRARTDDELS